MSRLLTPGGLSNHSPRGGGGKCGETYLITSAFFKTLSLSRCSRPVEGGREHPEAEDETIDACRLLAKAAL